MKLYREPQQSDYHKQQHHITHYQLCYLSLINFSQIYTIKYQEMLCEGKYEIELKTESESMGSYLNFRYFSFGYYFRLMLFL